MIEERVDRRSTDKELQLVCIRLRQTVDQFEKELRSLNEDYIAACRSQKEYDAHRDISHIRDLLEALKKFEDLV